MTVHDYHDVLVIGGGNAALCAALSAREMGASVLVLESSPRAVRGGNSRHTRNLRCMHEHPTAVLTEAYPEREFWDDLVAVTHGETNEALARLVIRDTNDCTTWMVRHGARFQPSLSGTLHLSRTNAFFLGGGTSLLNGYYRSAERMGVDIRYDAEVRELHIDGDRCESVVYRQDGAEHRVHAGAVVAASGGFQANIDWLRSIWGAAADNFLIRGTPFDDGHVLRQLIDHGAATCGRADQCHAVAIDARSPRFDSGIVTRVDCVSLGVVVNNRAERFYDEGEEFWPKRYAIWGRLVAQQPDQIAYVIIDSPPMGTFVPPMYPPISAPSLDELARRLGLDAGALERTIGSYNAAVRPGRFDHRVLDDCRTEGLDPPKTHWARPIDTPPFHAYPLRPGITFTYLGVGVDETALVQRVGDAPFANVFAAGEIMAGNILGRGYLAGFGMAIGTSFGRRAGRQAAMHGLQHARDAGYVA